MKDRVTRHDISILDSLSDPVARELVSTAVKSDFALTQELAAFADHVVMLDGNPMTLDAPPILYGGSHSLASTEFKFSWFGGPVAPVNIFSRVYQEMTAPGFRDCIQEVRPIIESIQCNNAVRDGCKTVDYTRVLLPATNGQGAWFFICYSFDPNRRRYPVDFEPAELLQQDHILENTSLHKPR